MNTTPRTSTIRRTGAMFTGWLATRRRHRGQQGYVLAAVIALLALVTIVIGALMAMTTTALRLSENFRDRNEVLAAADGALEASINALRRQQPNLTIPAEAEVCLNDPAADDPDATVYGPLDALEVPVPDGPVIPVEVTCSITSVDVVLNSRYGRLLAFVDGATEPTGLADFRIVQQASADEQTRVVISDWQIGRVDASVPPVGLPPLEVEFLVVGGGGAGGAFTGGGGGGGGVVTNLGGAGLRVNNGVFNVRVGDGGNGGQAAGPNSNAPLFPHAAAGQDSSFNGIVARGGGGGGSNNTNGGAGGSGGGGGHNNSTGGAASGNQGFPGAGSNVGNGVYGAGGGGGGGGAGGGGSDTRGGGGGGGLVSAISGAAVTYAGGGGGGAYGGTAVASGPAGSGGGGAGGYGPPTARVAPTNGVDGTGGGGGGRGGNGNTSGGNGGSGAVVVRYLGAQRSTGGTVSSAGGYTIHTFTTPGDYTLTITPAVEYLVVAGGGAGGGFTGAGGGGGGVLTNLGNPVGIDPGTYPVVVGAGAVGNVYDTGNNDNPSIPVAPNGQNSSFRTVVATGGGGGGSNNFEGAVGGSGGGGGHNNTSGGLGVTGQGSRGGGSATFGGVYGAGGGGGAGAVGGSGSATKGGDGGAGRLLNFTGVDVVYGGGGGGGAYGGAAAALGVGGAGGGGSGGYGTPIPVPPTSGAANTGGGGGGQRTNVRYTGGSGGSGIVIIRYEGSPRATGGTVTQANGYTFHTFTTPGTHSITFL